MMDSYIKYIKYLKTLYLIIAGCMAILMLFQLSPMFSNYIAMGLFGDYAAICLYAIYPIMQ